MLGPNTWHNVFTQSMVQLLILFDPTQPWMCLQIKFILFSFESFRSPAVDAWPFSHGSETFIRIVTMAYYTVILIGGQYKPLFSANSGLFQLRTPPLHRKSNEAGTKSSGSWWSSRCQKGSLSDRTQRRYGRRARCTHHPRDPPLARCRRCWCCWPRSARSSSIPGPSRSLRSVQNGSWRLAHQSPGEQPNIPNEAQQRSQTEGSLSQRSRWQAKCRPWSQALQLTANLPPLSQIHGDWEDRWHFATIYNNDHSGG